METPRSWAYMCISHFLFLIYNGVKSEKIIVSQKTLSPSKKEQKTLILFILTAHIRNVFRTLLSTQDGAYCENS